MCLYYIVIATIVLLLIITIIIVYTKKYYISYNSFLDLNANITLMLNNKKILFINKAGLVFFNIKNVSKLNEENNSFSNLFLEEEGFINSTTYGKNWLLKISVYHKIPKLKVKIYNQVNKMNHYFHITIIKTKVLNQYILSLNNITELEETNKNILKQANLDSLTNLNNRTKMIDIFNKAIFDAQKYNKIFSVILFDIDFFKVINDTYGHTIGDKALIELSRLAKSFLGSNDEIGRWGGEEFFIILNNRTGKESYSLAREIQKSISKYNFNIISHLSCSFGVTQFKSSDLTTSILERVDKALYKVKKRGRDGVELIV